MKELMKHQALSIRKYVKQELDKTLAVDTAKIKQVQAIYSELENILNSKTTTNKDLIKQLNDTLERNFVEDSKRLELINSIQLQLKQSSSRLDTIEKDFLTEDKLRNVSNSNEYSNIFNKYLFDGEVNSGL